MTNDPQNQNHDQGVMETGAVVEEAVYSLFYPRYSYSNKLKLIIR
jgi:hypothetical protein